MKKYIISEAQLRRLINNSLELKALDRNGVDNWCGYDDSFRELMCCDKEYIPGEDGLDWNEYVESTISKKLETYEEFITKEEI